MRLFCAASLGLLLSVSYCCQPTLAAQLPAKAPSAAKPAAKAPAAAKAAPTVAAAARTVPAAAAKSDPLDWPNWRGPEQNGISRETGIVDKWDYADEKTGNLLWSRADLGSISSPIVMRGKLYILCRHNPGTKIEQEKVACVDAATGKTIWENAFNVFLSDVPAERVGWSNCVGDPATGRVYAMGVCGYFQCLDGETGKTIWSKSLNEEYGLLSTYGGRTSTPVIFENLVIISPVIVGWGEMAKPTHRFLAMDKATGEVLWFKGTKPGPKDTTYSTPTFGVLGGQAAMVFGSGDGGVYAFQPRTGETIWSYQLSLKGLNVSPVIQDNKVYTGHSEENANSPTTMGGVVCLDGTKKGDISAAGPAWQASAMMGKSAPLLIDGRMYCFDEGAKLYVLDAATGEQIGKPIKLVGTIMRSSPIYADGKIYACTTSAWHVIQPTKDGAKITHKLRLLEEDEVSGSPCISHGRIYLPTGGHLYCIGEKDQKPAATARPELPAETPVSADDKPALVQVVPAEVLLSTSGKQKFTVRLFNDRGQFLKDSPATFSLDGPGEIDSTGAFVAPGGTAHNATIVTAKVGELTGQARIRIVPPLPWKFDFNDVALKPGPTGAKEGEPPVTWVAMRYRHKIREESGDNVMVKITTIPLGTRSQGWMGPANMHDYTIQADLKGSINDGKMPDMGVIAQRYTLDMMGANQKLQIRSWTAQVRTRFSKEVDFAWKPNVWYTVKFSAATENGQAVLKGKVWPRGETEPDKWTIEAVDEAPNLVGSPGLFGNATNAEIFVDNISVTANAATK